MQETQETLVPSLGWEDPLEEEMGTHSSMWKSHGQSSLVDSSPLGCKELGMTEHTCTCKGEGARYWGVTSVSFIIGNVK